jgi:hypothetical protein
VLEFRTTSTESAAFGNVLTSGSAASFLYACELNSERVLIVLPLCRLYVGGMLDSFNIFEVRTTSALSDLKSGFTSVSGMSGGEAKSLRVLKILPLFALPVVGMQASFNMLEVRTTTEPSEFEGGFTSVSAMSRGEVKSARVLTIFPLSAL